MQLSIFVDLLYVYALRLVMNGCIKVNGQDTTPTPYKLTSDKVQDFIEKPGRNHTRTTRSPDLPKVAQSRADSSTFDDAKAVIEPNLRAYCEGKAPRYNPKILSTTTFIYKEARCALGPPSRQYLVTCDTIIRYYKSKHQRTGEPEKFVDQCPPNYLCQNTNTYDENLNEIQSVICVESEDVVIEWIHQAEKLPGSPTTGLMHCTPEQWIPSSSHPMAPAEGVDVVLTEEVIYPNGSAYKSPLMLIHDKSHPYPLDPVWRRDVSIASAMLSVLSDHGRLQRKRIQFCFEIVPQKRDFILIFMNSWMLVKHRRGRIPE